MIGLSTVAPLLSILIGVSSVAPDVLASGSAASVGEDFLFAGRSGWVLAELLAAAGVFTRWIDGLMPSIQCCTTGGLDDRVG